MICRTIYLSKLFLVHLLVGICFSVFSVGSCLGAEIRGFVDRNVVGLGETFEFTVELKKRVNDQPDTTPLEKDFEVLGVSTSSQVNFTNGNMETLTSWIMTLSPRHPGTLTVPPVQMAGLSTDPIEITVSKSPKSIHDGSADIFIETGFEPEKPYVQQQVVYKVRLFYGPGLKEGSLEEPVVDNAVIKRLGKDASYEVERGGTRYRVNERTYAIFFQSSGDRTVAGPVFDGKVLDERKRSSRRGFGSFFDSDPLGMFTSLRRVRIQGDDRLIPVLARPETASGRAWLPATRVTLEEQWSPAGGEVKVGEPVTRTLTLTAKGLTGAQLPSLVEENLSGFRVYPDRADITSEETADAMVGKRVQKVAYIPESSGEYVLPAVTLEWWNVTKNGLETVSLPEKTIKVSAVPGQAVQPPPVSAEAGETRQEVDVDRAGTNVEIVRSESAGPERVSVWFPLFIVVCVGWLATLVLLFREKRRRGRIGGQAESGKDQAAGLREAGARVRTACGCGDPQLVRNALLRWGDAMWPDDPPKGLAGLAERLGDDRFAAELQRLDRALYSADVKSGWNWEEVRKSFERVSAGSAGREPVDETVLPKLYLSETG